jgi:hypothetical protein
VKPSPHTQDRNQFIMVVSSFHQKMKSSIQRERTLAQEQIDQSASALRQIDQDARALKLALDQAASLELARWSFHLRQGSVIHTPNYFNVNQTTREIALSLSLLLF